MCGAQSQPSQTLWANKGLVWAGSSSELCRHWGESGRTRWKQSSPDWKASSLQCPGVPLALLHQQASWIGLKSVVMVVRTRQLWNKTTHQVQFYLSVIESDAPTVARAIRLHWGIENQLHWTLDVTFAEDASRVLVMHRKISHSCDASRSIVSIASYPSNAAHGRNLIEQQWTMIICLKYFAFSNPTSMRNPLVNRVWDALTLSLWGCWRSSANTATRVAITPWIDCVLGSVPTEINWLSKCRSSLSSPLLSFRIAICLKSAFKFNGLTVPRKPAIPL